MKEERKKKYYRDEREESQVKIMEDFFVRTVCEEGTREIPPLATAGDRVRNIRETKRKINKREIVAEQGGDKFH